MPPMWTNENRSRYDRSKLRYPSDLTDEEWALIAPVIPPAKRGGGKRTVSVREVVNGLMYVLSTGCQWRAIPKDLPPRSTVNGYFFLWDWDGTLDRVHHALYVKCREQAFREASPTAAIIDSQSVKSAEKGGARIDPNGFDAGKKIKGKKRHLLVDTQGLVLFRSVHAADIQDRDGGVLVMATLFGMYPFLLKLYADGGYQGPQFQCALLRVVRHVDVEIVKRSDAAKGFIVLPRRWIVERTIGWLNRIPPVAAARRRAAEPRGWRWEVAAQALQPLRGPADWPPDTRRAMLAATYAKRVGRAVAFSLAAFRQAFAGGRDLSDENTVLIAAAACEMHPTAVLKGIGLRSVAGALKVAGERARDGGVASLPAIQVGDRVFEGGDIVQRAAAALTAIT